MADKPCVADLSFDALTAVIGGPGRAARVWQSLRAGDDPFELPTHWRPLLGQHCAPLAARVAHSAHSQCGTTKLAVQLADGAVVETVVIPRRDHSTVCISSQVGCARGCVFCATARMGRMRNLSAAEILVQVAFAEHAIRADHLPRLRNVVFMGMGEPLDNFATVAQSIGTLLHPRVWGLAPRQVTLSTVGPSVTAVRRLKRLPVSIAWSLHAADPLLRRHLVPNAKAALTDLRAAFQDALGRRTLFVEVTLLNDRNDSVEHAVQLADFLAPLLPNVRVNLLPMNSIDALGQLGSTPERVMNFRNVVRDRGVFCTVRHARGDDIAAACGQLVTQGFLGSVSSAGSSSGACA